MTSAPQEPLEQPVDAQDAAGQDSAGSAPVSGSPAGADSDLGYSRGDEGESAEQAGNPVGEGTDYLDPDNLMGPGDERNG